MGWSEDARAAEIEAQRKERLQASSMQDYDADLAGRVFRAAARTDLPQQVVAQDIDNIEKSLKQKDFNYSEYTDEVNGSPVFNKFAAENPYNYAALDRDRKNLTRFERTLEPIFQGWDSGWGMIELADIRDRQIKGDIREGDTERMKELRSLTEGAGDYFGSDNMFMKAMIMTAQQLPIQAWLIGESAEEISLGLTAGAMFGAAVGGGSTPMLAGAGAIPGAITGGLSGAGAGFWAGRTEAAFRLERGLAFDEYMELGLPEKDSLMMASGVGAINAAAESMGLGFITKRLPGFSAIQKNATGELVEKIFKNETFKSAMAKFGLAYGETMAVEIATEIIQESTLMAGREYLKSQARESGDLRPEMAAMGKEELFDSIKQIAIATMYGTSIIGAMGPAASLRQDYRRASDARSRQQMMIAMGESATDSETRKKSPEVWREFVERVKKDGPINDIRVDREGWNKYWQGAEIDPNDAAAELGLTDEQLNGDPSDVIIPLDVYADKIAPTDHHGALMPDVRFKEDQFTMRDAEKWHAEKDDAIARLESSIKEEFGLDVNKQIEEDLTGQLIAAGYEKGAAQKMGKLNALIFTNVAAMTNMDPMELYNQRLGGVRQEVPEALAGKDIDMDIDPILDDIRAGNFPQERDILGGGTLMDMIREVGGILDEGGELSSRDFGKQRPGTISKEGLSVDAIAEIAAERGFIPEYDQAQLYDAIDKELAGEKVFSINAKVDEDLQRKRDLMDQAVDWLESEGLDIENMSNTEVREAIRGIKTLEQSDTMDLDKLRTTLAALMDEDPSRMADIMRQMPRVASDQDFSSIMFTGKFVDKNDEPGTYEYNAQDAFDSAVDERNTLNQLMDCLNA